MRTNTTCFARECSRLSNYRTDPMDHTRALKSVEKYWSEQADTFDDEPDHGLHDPITRTAWRERLLAWLPPPPASVADLGCGTGSISTLLATEGYQVIGVDLSDAMIARAREKARMAGVATRFQVGDASEPDLRHNYFDAVVSRHLLWTLPDPQAALASWMQLLVAEGCLVLIEGRWATEANPPERNPELPWHGGVSASDLAAVLERMSLDVAVHDLSHQQHLWGKKVNDERFAIVARPTR